MTEPVRVESVGLDTRLVRLGQLAVDVDAFTDGEIIVEDDDRGWYSDRRLYAGMRVLLGAYVAEQAGDGRPGVHSLRIDGENVLLICPRQSRPEDPPGSRRWQVARGLRGGHRAGSHPVGTALFAGRSGTTLGREGYGSTIEGLS